MKTYFTGEFSARRPVTIAASLIMSTVGLGLAVMWLSQLKGHIDLSHLVGALGALLFILFFLGVGLFLLMKVLKNAKTTLAITSTGISYGSKTYPWKDVVQIGVMERYAKRRDLYCTTRSARHVIELLLSRGLSSGQIETLFESLRQEVLICHPHVQLGDAGDESTDC